MAETDSSILTICPLRIPRLGTVAAPTKFIFSPSADRTVIKQVILLDPISIAFIPAGLGIFYLMIGCLKLRSMTFASFLIVAR